MRIKAITLWQPWASLVAVSAKQYETRSWHPPVTIHFGDLIAIHAAQRSPRLGWEEMSGREMSQAMQALAAADVRDDRLPTGSIVAICELAWFVTTEEHRQQVSAQERAFGDWSSGRFAWKVPVVHRLPQPIAAKGHQGLWEWDVPDEVSEYLSELAGAHADWAEQMQRAGERL